MRKITGEQADKAYDILVQHAGARDKPDDRTSFVWSMTDAKHHCYEYRFGGSLGFGGKFRNDGNHDDTPYVDCYREDETPARIARITATNKLLADLFAEGTQGTCA